MSREYRGFTNIFQISMRNRLSCEKKANSQKKDLAWDKVVAPNSTFQKTELEYKHNSLESSMKRTKKESFGLHNLDQKGKRGSRRMSLREHISCL